MIKTRFVEVRAVEGQMQEIDIGWATLPEVPVEKKSPVAAPGQQTPPLVIKIGGNPFFIIGHTWDLTLTPSTENGPKADSETVLVLVVQAVPPMPSGLVRADASALDQIKSMVPPPGGISH